MMDALLIRWTLFFLPNHKTRKKKKKQIWLTSAYVSRIMASVSFFGQDRHSSGQ